MRILKNIVEKHASETPVVYELYEVVVDSGLRQHLDVALRPGKNVVGSDFCIGKASSESMNVMARTGLGCGLQVESLVCFA